LGKPVVLRTRLGFVSPEFAFRLAHSRHIAVTICTIERLVYYLIA